MKQIGLTAHGYRVLAIPPECDSPMRNHRGGEIAVDESGKTMYVWGVFVAVYGTDSIMKACNTYHPTTEE